jgi:PII-like signaling protein
MKQVKKLRLCIIVGEADHYRHTPLYEAIIYAAKKSNMAGATVLKGIMSYGEESKIRSYRFFTLSQDLPVTIYLIDTQKKVHDFILLLEKMLNKSSLKALITTDEVNEIVLD